jgi:DNA-directed RNA polymerase subunit RPC12/RpoP
VPYREVTKSDWWKGSRHILLVIVVIILSAPLLIPMAWPVGIVLWFLLPVCGSVFLLLRWHAGNTAYRCEVCGSEFEISAITDLVSPNLLDRKLLRCPQCGKRSRAKVLVKED